MTDMITYHITWDWIRSFIIISPTEWHLSQYEFPSFFGQHREPQFSSAFHLICWPLPKIWFFHFFFSWSLFWCAIMARTTMIRASVKNALWLSDALNNFSKISYRYRNKIKSYWKSCSFSWVQWENLYPSNASLT